MAKYYITQDNGFAGTGIGSAMPPKAVAEVPVAPIDGRQIWNGSAWVWPAHLARERAMDAIAARYDQALAAGMPYAGKVLQIRAQDQANLTTMGNEARWAKATGAPWPSDFNWRMADDSFLHLSTADDMIALGEAAKAEVYRLRLVKWRHADAVNRLGAVEDIEAYDLEAGWAA